MIGGSKMKKIWTLLIALVLVLAFAATAAADMGLPSIEPYDVVAGPNGIKTEIWVDGNQQAVTIPAGTRLTVESEFEDKLYAYYENNFVEFDASQVIQAGDTVAADCGSALEKPVSGTITANDGLLIRSGPSTNYDTKGLIPYNAEVSYSRVFSGDLNWAYVTYDGVSGWACVDYIAAKAEPEKPETDKQDETKPASEEQTASKPETGTTVTADADDSAAAAKPEAKQGSVLSTIRTVIICLILVLAAALAAILLLLRSRRKRDAALAEEAAAERASGDDPFGDIYASFDPQATEKRDN